MSASLAPECNEVKEKYDTCFLKWYSESRSLAMTLVAELLNDLPEYLRGNSSTDECEPLFKQYRSCLTKALKDKGIDSMLAETREGTAETDAEHLRR
ncbi:Mitochondrial distribution and morphology protein 35 [Cladophialophora carrionii]|uniref:Mitochondrial distribution and morphology protein 35 n=1 Tax=Cladophialophora carrionii TaxID=86049 RepID=A0A1C1CG68_9EURO|nr:Mitochondrial distribution and morphology protein 35 [Cladophialophora carrionii]